MEDQKFAPSVHDTTHSHSWMIVLLVGCLALIIALAGLFAYKYYQPQVTEVAVVTDDVKDVDEMSDTSIETDTFNESGISPGFTYPDDWHVYSSVGQFTGTVIITILNDGPIMIGEGEYFFPVQSATYLKSQFLGDKTLEEYIDSLENRTGILAGNDWNVESTNIKGANTYVVTGRGDFGDYPFEQVIYFGDLYVVTFTYTDLGDNLEEEWEMIKNSLDFSKIE